MKKLLFKILAFVGDYVIVTFIISLLTFVPFFNPNKKVVNANNEKLIEVQKEALEVLDIIKEAKEDDSISSEEYTNLTNECGIYCSAIREVEDGEVIEDWYKDVTEEIVNIFSEESNKIGYSTNRLSTRMNIVTVWIYVLYFGVLEFLLNGQTLMKRIFRLRTVDKDGKKLSLGKEIIKSILITELVFVITDMILVRFNYNVYKSVDEVIYYIKYFYELAFIIVMVVRDDNRSIHDLILSSNVILYDKNGKEVNTNISTASLEVETKEVKEVKTTKKPVKKSTNKKENVKAEKVKK